MPVRSSRRPIPIAAGLFCGALVVLGAVPARADLSADGARVARAWANAGAKVERMPPVFVEHGRIKAMDIDAALDTAGEGCTTVLVLGVRSLDFAVDTGFSTDSRDPGDDVARLTAPAEADERAERRVRSVAGAAVLERCGLAREDLQGIAVTMRSPRGALEIVTARGPDKLGGVQAILPERESGPVAPRGDPGRPIEPGAMVERLATSERRARDGGAERVSRVTMTASPLGTGEFDLRLNEGCHRLELLGEIPSALPHRATDVDAEVRDAEAGRLLARDRGEAADARLDFCLGEPTNIEAVFVGAAGAVSVTASDSRWSMPPTVPVHWGARARAGLSYALRRRNAPAPADGPIAETIGVQGTTAVPVAVEPGGCYLAAVGIVRGEARGIRLVADVGERAPRDEVNDRPEGAAVAFCSETDTSAVLSVDVRGSSPWWALAVWRVGSVKP